MSTTPPQPARSGWEQFSAEFGWTTLIISVLLGEATLSGVITAVISGPEMDIEGVDLFIRVFLTTAPLTLAAIFFFTFLLAGSLNSPLRLLWAGLGSLVGGALMGGALGTAVGLDPEWVSATIQRNGGSPPGMATSILTIVVGYYAIYGEGFFFASLAEGLFFGRWAAELVKQSP